MISYSDRLYLVKPFYYFSCLPLPRCGSFIVDLALKFSSIVRESKVLSILRDAAKNGMVGDFNVSASSIVGTRLERATTAATSKIKPTSSADSKLP